MTRIAHNSRFAASVILFLALCLSGLQGSLSLAQVTTAITSSGLNTSVSPNATNPAIFEITGGTRPGGGLNLFHSFGEFTIGAADTALFKSLPAEPTTSNILGRVTGELPSQIYGTIDSVTHYPGANLFLINPAGMVFGPDATLNVGGSVSFTTADYVRLFDGENSANFYANPASDGLANSVLSLAPLVNFGFLTPAAYGFLNPPDPSGTITVQGSTLMVPAGQSFTLAGGDITLTADPDTGSPASIRAPGGRINLASVASPGEIVAETLNQDSNINGQSFGALGTIQVSQQSVIDASGDGGGTVVIRGGRFVLDDSRLSANTTGPAVGPLVGQPGAGIDIQVSQDAVIQNGAIVETNVSENVAPGIGSGGVHVKADRIEILGLVDFDTGTFLPSTIRSNVAPGTGGRSGDITLEANSILMKDFAVLETTSGVLPTGPTDPPLATGDAGNIIVRTNQNVELENIVQITSASQFSSGNAGNIELTSSHGNILMSNFALLLSGTTGSSGVPGRITVSAPRGDILMDLGFINTFIGPPIGGDVLTGGSGEIQLTAKNLLLNSSVIEADNFGTPPPGNITVTLSDNLSLRGNSQVLATSLLSAPSPGLNIAAHDILITEGSVLSTEAFRSGPGGNLNVVAERVEVTNGGEMRSGAGGSGPGGAINLNVGDLFLIAGGRLTATSISTGNAGSVTVQGLASPANSVVIDGAGSGIFTTTEGTGAGGNINLAAQSVTLQNGGSLSASSSGTAPSATGGSIAISAGQSATLNDGASITASSTGPANAGNIFINAGNQFTMQDSSVTTQALQASGGNIEIKAADLVQLTNSQINTSVAGGEGGGGNITIDPNFVILQNSQILAQAFAGQGGNINITTGVFLPDANSIVDASSQFGVSGTVTIQSPTSNLSAVWARLQQNYAEVAAMLRARCAAQVSGEYSSFVKTGRDAIPLEPGGWLLSPISLSADAGRGARGEGARSVIASSVLASEGGIPSLRGFDRDISWPGLVQAPRRFVSMLDSACGS